MQATTQATTQTTTQAIEYRDALDSYIVYSVTVTLPRLEREFEAGDLESLHEIEQLEQQIAAYKTELAELNASLEIASVVPTGTHSGRAT